MTSTAVFCATEDLRPETEGEGTEVPSLATAQLSDDDVQVAKHYSRIAHVRSVREVAFALANTLCNQFHCEQVAVGLRRGNGIKVTAVSGCSQFKVGNPGIVQLRQAMEECVDHGKRIQFPDEAGVQAFPIHRQWSIACGNNLVCSIPLLSDGEVVGVISLRHQQTLSSDVLENLANATAPYGTLMTLVERAHRPVRQHVASAVQEWFDLRKSKWNLGLVIVLMVMTTWFCYGTLPYRPLCDSVTVPAELRNLTAPFEGKLTKVHVAAGDRVHQGDILLEFDTSQLQLELDSVTAEIARTRVSERAAIESSDVTGAALQQAHVSVLSARKTGLESRIRSATVVAPADGTIIDSRVEKKMGQVMAQGDLLLEFAPESGWKLLIFVPEAAAIYVDSQQEGGFASAAKPHVKVPFAIEQMDGSAEVIEEDNVFVARAVLQSSPSWMRSGMRGVARIDTVRKPVWWVVAHNVLDWTRLRFWI